MGQHERSKGAMNTEHIAEKDATITPQAADRLIHRLSEEMLVTTEYHAAVRVVRECVTSPEKVDQP